MNDAHARTSRLIGLVLALSLPAAAQAQTGDLVGQVTSEVTPGNFQPLAGATVSLYTLNGGGAQLIGTRVSNASGGFSFLGVCATSYLLLASAGAHNSQVEVTGVTVGQTTVTSLLLQPTVGPQLGGVVGQVISVTPGVGEGALAGANVRVWDGQSVIAQTTTDVEGLYAMAEIASGPYLLVVDAVGFDQVGVQFEVFSDGAFSLLTLMSGSEGPCTDCLFRDATQEKGLSNYRAGTGDGHAPGGVFADLNNDTYPDLYLMRALDGFGSGANQLFLNVPDAGGGRTFVQVANNGGAGDPGAATGAIAGDYDNDGDLDLYVTNFDQPNVLLQNQFVETGVLQFVDVTADTDPTPGVADDQLGVGNATWQGVLLDNSLTAAWADVDRDGDLDLYVGNHNGFFGSFVEGPFSVPGRRDVFYLNNGDGTFTDATMQTGIPGYEDATGQFVTTAQRFSSTNGVVFADFNNDQWPDLLVTNKIGGPPDRDMLYINQGNDLGGNWQGFSTVTYSLTPTFGHASGAAMGVAVGDIENDGDLDIYITDWNAGPFEPGTNDLWINQFAETGQLSFMLSDSIPATFSWGAQWQDVDNNGFIDMHVVTNAAHREYLYFNTAGAFVENGVAVGTAKVRNARGDMAADYNRDGWVDLFVVNLDSGPSVLYENNLATLAPLNHYLVIKLQGDPSLPGTFRSSRDAIGARVRVTADLDDNGVIGPDETQMREIVSGDSNAASTSSLELEFGLSRAMVANVEIDWPSGRHWVLDVAADQYVTLIEAMPGDFNFDGSVGFDDVSTFVAVLLGLDLTPNNIPIADMNNDSSPDGLDIQLFTEELLQP